jgi:hypothetical protein
MKKISVFWIVILLIATILAGYFASNRMQAPVTEQETTAGEGTSVEPSASGAGCSSSISGGFAIVSVAFVAAFVAIRKKREL